MAVHSGQDSALLSRKLEPEIETLTRILIVLFLLLLIIFASSCSSVSGAANNQPVTSTPAVAVIISPTNARIAPGETVQFTARVSGTANAAVVWSAKGGTISSNGLFVSSKSTSSATITATSAANPDATASADVSFSTTTPLAITSKLVPEARTGAPYNVSLTSSGGTPPYTWSIASGSLPPGLTLASSGTLSGTPIQVGTYTFSVKVTDSESQSKSLSQSLSVSTGSSLNYSGFDGPAELPREYMQTNMADTPAPGSTITVKAGGDLQGALNSANCGDTILLASGAVFSGQFTIPAKPCDDHHWIIVRSSAPDSSLPTEGTRINPCYAGVGSLPARPKFTCPAVKNVMAKILYTGSNMSGPILLDQGANHYRFIGLEITRDLPQKHVWNLVGTKNGDGAADHLIFDRDWLHGTATDETKGGVHLSGITYAAVIDSYFSDFHCIAIHGTCTDSQAVNGGTGDLPAGPYKIVNNFLEAAGQSIMFGGGGGTTSPTDIEIRYNHLFKPATWQTGTPNFVGAYTGDAYIVKNHFELKNAQRVLFEGNLLENVWGGFTQSGYSILLTPVTQGGACIPCQVTDITIRYNRISNVAGGFDLGNSQGDTGGFAKAGERYSIHDVVLENVDKTKYNGYGLFVMMISNSPKEVLNNVSIQHNTAFPDANGHILSVQDTATTPMSGFVFANNLIQSPPYPIWSAGGGNANCAVSNVPLTVMQKCFPGYVFSANVIAGSIPKYPADKWPAGQSFVDSIDSVGFVNYAQGNYALSSSSAYKGKATDGRDVGADIATLDQMTAGVP